MPWEQRRRKVRRPDPLGRSADNAASNVLTIRPSGTMAGVGVFPRRRRCLLNPARESCCVTAGNTAV